MRIKVIHPTTALGVAMLLAICGPSIGPFLHPNQPPAAVSSADPLPISSYSPDVNSDPVGRIRLIPGIGPVKAAAIVRERQQHGPFLGSQDVQARVGGIGPALERQISEFAQINKIAQINKTARSTVRRE